MSERKARTANRGRRPRPSHHHAGQLDDAGAAQKGEAGCRAGSSWTTRARPSRASLEGERAASSSEGPRRNSGAIISCGALALDVRTIARRRRWDLEVVPVDALLHNQPDQIAPAVAQLRQRHDVVALAYADCGTQGALDELGLPRLAGDHCYDVFARDEVAEALAEEPGTYFLTDFLARTFEHTVVRELGLDRHPELCQEYFRNYTRVMWLAQRPTAATRECAEAAAARLGLPLEVREVGSSGLERELERLLGACPEPVRA